MPDKSLYRSDLPIVIPVTCCPGCGGANLGVRFCIDCGSSLRRLS